VRAAAASPPAAPATPAPARAHRRWRVLAPVGLVLGALAAAAILTLDDAALRGWMGDQIARVGFETPVAAPAVSPPAAPPDVATAPPSGDTTERAAAAVPPPVAPTATPPTAAATPTVTAAKPPPVPNPRLRDAQLALVRLGYDPGPPDGLLGPQTVRALSAFQHDRTLPETGTLTDQTLQRLLAD
jgi:hypothetical protein